MSLALGTSGVKSGWGSMKTRMVESRKYRTGWFSKIVRV